jgi:MoaA/NifB/PqqE/SkfB family radical SAM enzyme
MVRGSNVLAAWNRNPRIYDENRNFSHLAGSDLRFPMTHQHLRANRINKYRALWEAANGIASVETIPTQLQIALTNTCNLKCVYCGDHRAGNSVPRTKLEGETWSNMLRLIPKAEWLAFHGISEFMMDPNFFELVQQCADADATLFINTNGTICTPKYLEALANYPGKLIMNFSVDAATPDTFASIRGWHFWRVVRNIKTYVDAFEARRDRTKLALSFVVTKSNVHEMVSFLFLAEALRVNSVVYFRLHEYDGLDWRIETKNGGIFDYREECTGAFVDQYNREIENTRKAAEVLNIEVTLPAAIERSWFQQRTRSDDCGEARSSPLG